MRTPYRDQLSRALIPLAIALPFALLGTTILPGEVSASLPFDGATPDPHGAGGRELVRAGNGSVPSIPSSGDFPLSISPPSATVVSGQSVVLTAVVGPFAGVFVVEVDSYDWSLSNVTTGSLSAPGANPTTFDAAPVLAPTIEEVSLTVFGLVPDAFGVQYVQASASASITVVAPLSLSPLRITPDPTTPGTLVAFTTTLSGGLPGYETTFDFGDGSSEEVASSAPGIMTATHEYDGGVFSPTVNATSSDGEVATAGSESTVVVTLQLAASIVVPSGADQGAPLTVQASVGGGTPPYSYAWENSWGGSYYGTSSWSFVPSLTGTLGLSLTVTDASGRTAVAPAESLSVHAAPSIGLQTSASRVDVGTPFPLDITVSGGTGPFQLTWTPGLSSPTLMTELPGDGNFAEPYVFDTPGQVWTTASVVDSLGVTSETGSMTGTVEELPQLNLGATPLAVTVGSPFVLTAEVAGGISPYSWSWSFSGPVSTASPSAGDLPGPGDVSWNGTAPVPESFVATLRLTDSSGGSVQSSLSLSVESPLIASLSSPQGRAEVGAPLVLSATITGGLPGYLLSLTASDGEAFQSQVGQGGFADLSLIPRVPGNLTVGLTVQDQLGRTYLASTVVPVAPALSSQISLSSDPVDTGTAATATLTLQGGWAPYSGTITSSNGLVVPFQTARPQIVVALGPASPGSLVLRASASDALGESTLTQRSLQIDTLPAVALTVGSLETDVGTPVPFLVAATGGTGDFPQVTLDFGDGNVSSSWSPTHTYARAGTYLVNASVVDSSGGRGSSAPLRLVVDPAPSVSSSLSSVGADVGVGAAFSSEVEFGTAPFSYLWDFGDGTQSEEADPTHDFAAPGLYRVNLAITDASGQSVSAPVLNVTVAPSPTLSVSANRTDLEVGIGATFQAQVLGGAALASVLWSFGDGSTLSGLCVNHTFQSAGAFSVGAELRDGAGGSASATLVVDVAPSLQVGPVGIDFSQAEVGTPLTLSESPSGGLGPYQLSWQAGAVQSSGSELTSWTLTPASAGTLVGSVQVTDAAGVRGTADFLLPVLPALSLNLTSAPSAPETNLPFRLSAGAAGGVGTVSFSWSLPSGWGDPGNRSGFDAIASGPGSYPVTVDATDALGRTVTATLLVVVAPPLELSLPSSPWEVDAGVPVQVQVGTSGGTGPVITRLTTPFGSYVLGGAPLVFPNAGVYPVQFTSIDQDGAVALARENMTVVPAPSLELMTDHLQVASGQAIPWCVQVLGGSAPETIRWSITGVGTWEGTAVNITVPVPGTYALTVSVDDSAGGSQTRWWNFTAAPDDLRVALNASALFGVAPFQTALLSTVEGGTGPVVARIAVDSSVAGAWVPVVPGDPWVLPLDLGPGLHVVQVQAQDAIGGAASASIEITSLPPLPYPMITPSDPVAQAGVPLALSSSVQGTNGTNLPGESVALAWWGAGVRDLGDGESTFLSDRAGSQVVMLSTTVSYPGAPELENTTLPVTVRVLPGAASELVAVPSSTAATAGLNATIELEATDAFGNPVPGWKGNVTCGPVSGAGETLTSVAPVVEGVADIELNRTRSGTVVYLAQASGLSNTTFTVRWTANGARAVLQLVSWEILGTSLVLNISAFDEFGNPLNNITVSAEVPGGPTTSGVVHDGNLTLTLPGAAEASTIVLSGPDGASTTVALPDPADPSADPVGWVAVVAFLGGLLVTGILLARRHRRRQKKGGSDPSELAGLSPSLLEAKGTLEDIIEHLPGEERDALLILAEEHGIGRSEAEEALVLLEKDGKVDRRTNAEGVERFEPHDPRGPPRRSAGTSPATTEARP